MQGLKNRRRDEKLDRLARQPLLELCSDTELRHVSSLCDEADVPAGQVVVRQGFRGHWFFLIAAGRADVVRDGATVGMIGPGHWFGETSIVDGGPEPCTIRARTPMVVFVLDHRVVPALLEQSPSIRRRLLSLAADGVTAAHRATPPREGGATVQPALGSVVQIGPATRRLPTRSVPIWSPSTPGDVVPIRPPRSRGKLVRWVGAAVALVAALSLAGAVYHPPVAMLSPGPAYDVAADIQITGVEVSAPSGRYLMTSVRVERPTAWQTVAAALSEDREIVSIDRVVPRGADVDELRREQRRLFEESRLIAAAAAARVAGLPVAIHGSGARATRVLPNTPGAAVLRRDDVVIRVSGAKVTTATELHDAFAARPAGSPFAIAFLRGDREHTATISTEPFVGAGEVRSGIGVEFETRDLSVDLPFEIRFASRDIGGRSAGLAFGLAILDMLDASDDAKGRIVAATGTIDEFGIVGRVGGLRQKVRAASQAGASLLLIPSVQPAVGDDLLIVRRTASLREAAETLRAA